MANKIKAATAKKAKAEVAKQDGKLVMGSASATAAQGMAGIDLETASLEEVRQYLTWAADYLGLPRKT